MYKARPFWYRMVTMNVLCHMQAGSFGNAASACISVATMGRLLRSVLKCAAVCCSVLQCVAVCCSVLQCVAVCCSVLQYVAVCCNVLQCVVVCCSVPIHI